MLFIERVTFVMSICLNAGRLSLDRGLSNYIQINKLLLYEESKISISVENALEIDTKNAIELWSISRFLRLNRTANKILVFISRNITDVSNTHSFLSLNFEEISMILASPDLSIDSEFQIIEFANKWLNFNIESRGHNAKALMLKSKLHFLNPNEIRRILNDYNTFRGNDDCVFILESLLRNRNLELDNKSQSYFNIKRCNYILKCTPTRTGKLSFNLLDCHNLKMKDSVIHDINCSDLRLKIISIEDHAFLITTNYTSNLGARMQRPIYKYSPQSKTLQSVGDLPGKMTFFSACGLVNRIFFFGGRTAHSGKVTNTCLQFDVDRLEWLKICTMPTARSKSSSTVFKDNIVVSGGKAHFDLQVVEQYNVSQNTWTEFPNLVKPISLHASCSLNGKIFVVGRHCEVYDTTANRFSILNSTFKFSEPELVFNRHVLFAFSKNAVYCYNPHDERWCEKALQSVNQPTKFCCGLVSLM